jgi:hypothetical protein
MLMGGDKALRMDITGMVDVMDPSAVAAAVTQIFSNRYPDHDFTVVERLYEDFHALYSGEFPGFLACETDYHDIQHVLDVSLAMARLLDGYDKSHPPAEQLGPELAEIGLLVALFHDSGYIRRKGDTRHLHGAEYTKIHVTRSARFIAQYLPLIGRTDLVELCTKLVHFTGYEFQPDEIEVDDPKHRILGCMAGTADVIAQMADPSYLEKCRDRLYPEFEIAGIAREVRDDGSEQVVYASAQDLLVKTPEFIKATITQRLDGHFGGLYHYVAAHFGGVNLYMQSLENNCQHLEELLSRGDESLLVSPSLRPSKFA